MGQTFIEQCRLWCDNGEMRNLIRWGKESKDIYRLMKIIEFYEHEIAIGNPRPTDFEYIPNAIAMTEGIQPIVTMDWVDALTLKEYIAEHISQPEDIKALAENFKAMVSDLHKNNLSHGDLQHGNIMVRGDGSLVLVDYDSMYVPSLDGYTDDIQGLAGYQHPCRGKNKTLSPKVDYFSELIIYTSLRALAKIPALWSDLQIEDTETLLFTAEDIESKGSSRIFDVLHQDYELAPMVDKIREYLQFDNIEELLPLEDALVPPTEKFRSKWNDPKYQPKPETIDHSKTIEAASQKWNQSQPIEPSINPESISKKW